MPNSTTECPAGKPLTYADSETVRDPFSLLSTLRQQNPIFQDPVTGYWFVTRYEDAVKVLQNPAVFSSRNPMTFNSGEGVRPTARQIAQIYAEKGFPQIDTLITNDPPSHTRYRALIDRQFTPANVRQLEPGLTAMVDELLSQFPAGGAVNFSTAFANKLPVWVIADQLGIERDKADLIKLWSDITIEMLNPAVPPEREVWIANTLCEMQQYLWQLAQGYQNNPADNLYSRLVHAEFDGGRLKSEELVALAYHILVAGNETTVNALETSMFVLSTQAGMATALRADASLIPNFVEEIVRINTPIPQAMRVTMQDTDIDGMMIPKGAVVLVSLLSANHDEDVFECPHQVSLKKRTGRHLGFSRGIHTCLGLWLARAELRIAITRLLERLDELRLDETQPMPRHRPLFGIRKLEEVHIRYRTIRH